jgi:hypothetical protein
LTELHASDVQIGREESLDSNRSCDFSRGKERSGKIENFFVCRFEKMIRLEAPYEPL